MRHEPTEKDLCNKAGEFALQFVEATGDLMSLSSAVENAVRNWFKRHENKPEDSGD